uniref:Uncharacterized protein n=1 Tax=Heterorhabditis bacteriophora TaxID=37862 RepID=A0A1I7WES8_HETBA
MIQIIFTYKERYQVLNPFYAFNFYLFFESIFADWKFITVVSLWPGAVKTELIMNVAHIRWQNFFKDIDGKRVTIFGFRLFSYEVESYINLLIFLIFDIYNKMSLSVLFELRPKSSQYEKSTTSSSFVKYSITNN